MPLRVVAAGECMLELARDGGNWRLGAAGDSFNTALYLRRLGAEVRYLTALGVDPFSEEMLVHWQDEGLDCSLVLREPSRLPGLYAIRTDADGERTFHYWRQHSAVRRLLALEGIDDALQAAMRCDLLYLTGITLSLFGAEDRGRLIELAVNVRAGGGRVAFDPNFRPAGWSDAAEAAAACLAIAPHADFVLTTDTDDLALWNIADARASARHWQRSGAREIVVKQGEKGATVSGSEGVYHVDIPAKVMVRDTTGAGDSFNAAYLAARLGGASAAEAALAGHRLAALVVQVSGAIIPARIQPDVMPSRRET